MKITRTSQATGKINTMDLPVTDKQLAAWHSGTFAQDAFPDLNADEREFIMTGITPEEWNEMFPPEEEEEMFPPDYCPDCGTPTYTGSNFCSRCQPERL